MAASVTTGEAIVYVGSRPAERVVPIVRSRGVWTTWVEGATGFTRLDIHRCPCGETLAQQVVTDDPAAPHYWPAYLHPALQQAKSNPNHFFFPSPSERASRRQPADLGSEGYIVQETGEPPGNIIPEEIFTAALALAFAKLPTKTIPPWHPTARSVIGDRDRITIKCGCGRVVEVTSQD
jgi:hypothetical protein